MPIAAPDLPPPPPSLLDAPVTLFLDFDGTLVELAERHDGVVVDPHVPRLVRRLTERLDGRVAVISGRPADDLLAYLDIDPAHPGLAIAGSHGMEMIRADGTRLVPERPASLDRAVAELHAFAARHEGLVVERKPFGTVLHYRQAPALEAEGEAVARSIAEAAGLSLQHGKMVFELRAAGAHKGDAVRTLYAEPPMAGTRPVFLGDDLTDEAGFEAAAALGGAGILIGDRVGATAARYHLADVTACHAWLDAIAGVTA